MRLLADKVKLARDPIRNGVRVIVYRKGEVVVQDCSIFEKQQYSLRLSSRRRHRDELRRD